MIPYESVFHHLLVFLLLLLQLLQVMLHVDLMGGRFLRLELHDASRGPSSHTIELWNIELLLLLPDWGADVDVYRVQRFLACLLDVIDLFHLHLRGNLWDN